MKLFVDTWGWLTLCYRGEAQHQEVVDFYNHFYSQGGSVYTTDYILDETFTLLFRRLSFSQAQKSVKILDEAVLEGYVNLEWVTPERFAQRKVLRLKFQDKPRVSSPISPRW